MCECVYIIPGHPHVLSLCSILPHVFHYVLMWSQMFHVLYSPVWNVLLCSMFSYVLCSGMFSYVLLCCSMFSYVLLCSSVFSHVLCSGMFSCVLTCSVFWNVLLCSVFSYVLTCSVFFCVLLCSGMFSHVLVCCHMFCVPLCSGVRVLLRSGQSLKVREHKVLGPYVDGLSQLAVTNFEVNTHTHTHRRKITSTSHQQPLTSMSLCVRYHKRHRTVFDGGNRLCRPICLDSGLWEL